MMTVGRARNGCCADRPQVELPPRKRECGSSTVMPRRHNIELLKPGMAPRSLGDPGKVCSRIRSVVRIVFSVSLAALVVLTGCSRDSGSRIHVNLHDIPEAKPAAQTVIKTDPSCPAGDRPDVDFRTARSPNHSVKLSWNLAHLPTGRTARIFSIASTEPMVAPSRRTRHQRIRVQGAGGLRRLRCWVQPPILTGT